MRRFFGRGVKVEPRFVPGLHCKDSSNVLFLGRGAGLRETGEGVSGLLTSDSESDSYFMQGSPVVGYCGARKLRSPSAGLFAIACPTTQNSVRITKEKRGYARAF